MTLITCYPTVRNVKNRFRRTSDSRGNVFRQGRANIRESFQVGLGDTVIGIDPGESGVKLDDRTVSKRHPMIGAMSRVCHLNDLGSTTGTEADGRNLGGVAVSDGDVIKAGKIGVRFVRESKM
ncbi:MAG: FHA domain-containing protein [Dehalococcoidia bacterium]|nr:FHA domain-containing protein [Dehalococcoidia bacterium]